MNTPDALVEGPTVSRPGAPCPDAPLDDGFLLDRLGGEFCLLAIDTLVPEAVEADGIVATRLAVAGSDDPTGTLAQRYLGSGETAVYLIRPDQHVAARWPEYDPAAVQAAINRAVGRN